MAAVTNGYVFSSSSDPITSAKLNLLGQPSVTIGAGEVVTANIASGNTYTNPVLSGTVSIASAAQTDSFSSTISMSVASGVSALHTVACTGSTNATINLSAGGVIGQLLRIKFTTDGTGGNVITYGTNFKSAGTHTLTGTNKTFTSTFMSDGTSFLEIGRTAALS